MADTDMMDRQHAYRAAVKTAGFNKSQLIYLHKATEAQVDKWLWSEKGYPPFQACYELFSVCRRMDFDVPDLKRLCNRSSNIRPTEFIGKFFVEEIGKKIIMKDISGSKNFKYLFNGELQTMNAIAKKLGMTRRQLYSRIYIANGRQAVAAGTDITELSDSKNYKYVFNGELQTINAIAQTLGMTKRQLYGRIYAANGRQAVAAGTDITHLAKAKKIGRPKK